MFPRKHPALKGIGLDTSVQLAEKYSLEWGGGRQSFIYLLYLELTHSSSMVLHVRFTGTRMALSGATPAGDTPLGRRASS